ncbi:MAG: hypothetical protein D6712_15175 [Chloroflexi bacterium]|nr:MAG: hypothetical protein D6712_15175 [Chloroflexota bacterium]
MATTSRTWFYSTPEPRPYYIEERINHSLWNNRLQGIYMSCTQATPPIQMVGEWDGIEVQFEWVPGKSFILRMSEDRKEMIGVLRQILLGLRPVFTYQDPDGFYVTEWHTDGGDERWKALQGDPRYQNLRRIKSKK